LRKKRAEREDFAKKKFEPGGEYDQQAAAILKPVEEKLYTVVQDVSASEGYDVVLDKTTMPIPYVNPKYDLTVKVLKKLNIPADDLEEKQKKAIEDDPRNKKDTKKDEPQLPRKRSRTSDSEDKKTETKSDTKTDTPATDIPR
ncbi:MAG: OmpH family outer membrane protein, partial [Candidatus Kapabacteria bacterium]|nr:OmpH family outer membrane protein [Candidatus Kapabacteria bacterium]